MRISRTGVSDETSKYEEPRFPLVLLVPAAVGGVAGWYLARLGGARFTWPGWSAGSFVMNSLVTSAVAAGALLGMGLFLTYNVKRTGRVG